LSDSWNAFWERLIIEGVAVLVGSFLLQGLWFLATDLLVGWSPGMEPGLLGMSARLGWVWALGTLAALTWVVFRARTLLEESPRRR
jgi:hypothetical protein